MLFVTVTQFVPQNQFARTWGCPVQHPQMRLVAQELAGGCGARLPGELRAWIPSIRDLHLFRLVKQLLELGQAALAPPAVWDVEWDKEPSPQPAGCGGAPQGGATCQQLRSRGRGQASSPRCWHRQLLCMPREVVLGLLGTFPANEACGSARNDITC